MILDELETYKMADAVSDEIWNVVLSRKYQPLITNDQQRF